ncbi:PREDICTED: putative nuclease HARBI1 [Vollenhovia emeryi]|uniref:putative nuclease HARBI1 n=1 Tax=Vollenhovia emeryi TaxID=411798 RepID=UPI0005F45BAE|nr:PREDICTED: putative nuclease HARBI1 [Vollenhovia emeryi]
MENIEDWLMNDILFDDSSDESNDEEEEVLGLILYDLREQGNNAKVLNILADGILNEIFYPERQNNEIVNLHYFEEVIPRYSDNQFYLHFRMHRGTYMELENIVRPLIRQRENDIPLSKKLFLTVWIIATPESFRSVADRFGLSKGIAWKAFKEVVWTLRRIMPRFIRWPNNEDCEESEKIFRIRSRGFPGVVGAIDGCHIAIKQPPRNANDYYNRKEFHSIILQGVCDHTGKFIDCLIGRPGRAHDAAVFRSSIIYTRLTDQESPLLPAQRHIIGDSAYPLLQNVMTPFRDNGNLTPEKLMYNTRLSSIRSIIERAYGLLKGKWRRLKYLDVQSTEMANHIIAAACTLHNFLILRNEIEIKDNLNINEYIEREDQDSDESDNNECLGDNGRLKRQEIANRFQIL